MQNLLQILAEAVRRLAGAGAADNAACEVERAARSVIELNTRLGMLEPPPRRAA